MSSREGTLTAQMKWGLHCLPTLVRYIFEILPDRLVVEETIFCFWNLFCNVHAVFNTFYGSGLVRNTWSHTKWLEPLFRSFHINNKNKQQQQKHKKTQPQNSKHTFVCLVFCTGFISCLAFYCLPAEADLHIHWDKFYKVRQKNRQWKNHFHSNTIKGYERFACETISYKLNAPVRKHFECDILNIRLSTIIISLVIKLFINLVNIRLNKNRKPLKLLLFMCLSLEECWGEKKYILYLN